MALFTTALLWRDQLLANGGWEEGRVTAEDWELWLRLARSGATFCSVQECLYYYRKHGASATARRKLGERGGRAPDDDRTGVARGWGVARCP